MLNELKKFKVQINYKNRNDRRIFHPSDKLIASDSDIDEEFKSMHQSIMIEIKKYASQDCIVLDVIINTVLRFFGDNTRRKNGNNK